MKTFGTVLLAVVLLLFGCAGDKFRYDEALAIAVDQTDTLNQYPTAEQLLTPFRLKDNLNKSVIIMIKPINDRGINPQYVFVLERENVLTGNPQMREAQVSAIVRSVQHCLDSLRPRKPMEHSVIFKPLVDQATALKAISAETLYMVVVSDLNENGTISFYDTQTRSALEHSPDQIQKQLEQSIMLKDCTGINLWLWYRPNRYKDNKPYETVSGFYKRMFEQRGATVHIDQNFNQ